MSERLGSGAVVRGDAPVRRGDVVELTIDSLAFGGAGVARVLVDAGEAGATKGMAVFVEGTVPGDRVLVKIGAKKRRYLVGYVEEFLERSSRRVEPKCKHFGTCGGCSLQSLSYEDQLKFKEQHVRDAFERIGGFGLADETGSEGVSIRPIVGCEEPWYYRNKMELSFTRTLEGRLDLGLHVRRRHHDVVELTECFLMSEYVGDFVAGMREFFRTHEPKVSAPRGAAVEVVGGGAGAAGQGQMKPLSLVVREGKYTGEILVNLIYENGTPGFLEEFVRVVREFFEGLESADGERAGGGPSWALKSVYFTNMLNMKGSPKKVEEQLLWGEAVIRDELRVEAICARAHEKGVNLPDCQKNDGLALRAQTFGAKVLREQSCPEQTLKFEISPQAFFQPNSKQAGVLYGEVLKAAALTGKETVFDLFCGAGTIGSFCAAAARRVVGVELNASAVENARRNAQLNGIENIEFFCGDVAKLLEEISGNKNGLLKGKNKSESVRAHTFETVGESDLSDTVMSSPDVVIVDPPRNGLELRALELAAALQAKRLVYVSCNPTTQARDAALLKKLGYDLQYVQPVDMFPHTWHIEGVALFTC